MIEYIAILLIAVLAILLTLQNRRMASSLRGVERVVQDFYAMQVRDRREEQARMIGEEFSPLAWISDQARAGLSHPIEAIEIIRLVPEMNAVDLRTADNHRLVVSTSTKSDILNFDKRLRAKGGKSVSQRLESFASRPLLNQSMWGRGVEVVERVLSDTAEFFDIEAQAAGSRLGIQWNNPTRLYFYVLE